MSNKYQRYRAVEKLARVHFKVDRARENDDEPIDDYKDEREVAIDNVVRAFGLNTYWNPDGSTNDSVKPVREEVEA